MAETIIPGTYITVRAEGLISAGRIATGIVGVVGTAARGQVGKPMTLASFGNARELFGAADDFDNPEDNANPLTLVRALEQAYNNGASTVVAVRAASATYSSASYAVLDEVGRTVATLAANTPGTWGNSLRIQVEDAQDPARISREEVPATLARLRYAPVMDSAENQFRIFRGTTRHTETLIPHYRRRVSDERVPNVGGRFILQSKPLASADFTRVVVRDKTSTTVVREYAGSTIHFEAGAAPASDNVRINTATGEITFAADQLPKTTHEVLATYGVGFDGTLERGHVLVTTWDGSLEFASGAGPVQADRDQLIASYLVAPSSCVRVTLSEGTVTERYTVPDGRMLAELVRGSKLVSGIADQDQGDKRPAQVDAFFGTGSNPSGNNGADAGQDDYAAALDTLSNETINIVVLAGQDTRKMGPVLESHLNQTGETDRERIGVIGAPGTTLEEALGHSRVSDRLIVVAPGIANPDGPTLPAAYTAAAVAGLMSSLAVQTSLTNKALNVFDLALDFNRGQQEQLIQRNVLAVVRKNGFRLLKGVTTAGEGTPFSSIPIRRIVDYARYGVRSAANPYIGRLNNPRVRAALKATVDAFLTRMVDDEALTAYELEVTATRPQEIRGEVNVTMTLKPTFSIDFVMVTMILK